MPDFERQFATPHVAPNHTIPVLMMGSEVELPSTFRAVRWHPPSFNVQVEELPIPTIQHPDDAIIRIELAGLCGSDLHVYRGHSGVNNVHICGHEFVGSVAALGASFGVTDPNRPSLYSTLRVGDKVFAAFSTSCGECNPCRAGFTSRCVHSLLLGSPKLDGAQAQYIRVPHAGGTLSVIPPTSELPDACMLLLADILPTGLFAATQALNHPKTRVFVDGSTWPPIANFGAKMKEEDRTLTFAVIGLGPVGLCACIALVDMLESLGRKWKVVGVDLNATRREKVLSIWKKMGLSDRGEYAVEDSEGAGKLVASWTQGIGFNAIIEAVGHPSAMKLGYDIVRSFGVISSVGVHAPGVDLPFTGENLYNKNISLDFGRCPARSMAPAAAELLARRKEVFQDDVVERIVGLNEAKEAYELFDKGKVGKILFDPWK